MPRGRPTKYTERIANKICAGLASGKSLLTVCRDPGMPSTVTVFKWLGENEEFLNKYSVARECLADVYFEQITDIADEPLQSVRIRRYFEKNGNERTETITHDNVERAKLMVDARKFAVARMAPKKYGERIDLGVPETDQDLVKELAAALKASPVE